MKRPITSKQDKSVQENDVAVGAGIQLPTNGQEHTNKRLSKKSIKLKKQKLALLQKKLDQDRAEQEILDKKKKKLVNDAGNPSDNLAAAEHDGVIAANADVSKIEGIFLKTDTTGTTKDPSAGGAAAGDSTTSSSTAKKEDSSDKDDRKPIYLAFAGIGLLGAALAGGGGGGSSSGSGSDGSTTGPNIDNGPGVTNGGINANEANSGVVTIPVSLPAGVVAGNVITLTIPGSNGGTAQTVSYTITAQDIANGKANVPVSAAVLRAAGDGQKTITATVRNGAGQVGGTIAVGTVTVDLTAPSAPSAANVAAAKQRWDNSELANGLNAAEAQNGTNIPVPLSSNVVVGDTVILTLPASGSGTAQTISHVVTAAEVSAGVAEVAVSSTQLADSGNGNKPVTAVIRDVAGNVSSPITVGSFLYDTVPPSAPSATSVANASNLFNGILGGGLTSANMGSSKPVPVPLPANAQVGDVVTLSIPSANSSTPILVPYTVTAADIAVGVGQINVPLSTWQAAGDGSKPLTVSFTDAVGNVGPTGIAVGTVSVNLTAPNLETNSGVLSGGLNAAELANNASIPIPVRLPSNTTAGDVIHLTIPGSGGNPSQTVHYTVTAGDVAAGSALVPVPSSTITATGSGDKVITATITDTETNTTSSSSAVGAVTVNTTPPSAPSAANVTTAQAAIANSNLANGVNAQEVASGVVFPVPLPGNVVIGDVVTVSIPTSAGGPPQVVNYTVTAADVLSGVARVPVSGTVLTAAGDGSKPVTAVVTDSTGNAGAPIPVGTFVLDTTPPNAPSAASIAAAAAAFNAALGDGVNAAEAAAGIVVATPLPQNVVVGDVVTLTIPGTNGGTSQTVVYTVTAADVTVGYASIPVGSGVLTLSGNGSKVVTAMVRDVAGNQSASPIPVGTFLLDTVPPSAPSAANVAAANSAFQSGELGGGGLNALEAADGTRVPVALPANAQTGDVVTLTLTNTGGGAPVQVSYTVTAADVTAGVASVPVSAAQLTSVGNGTVTLTASVMDTVGNHSQTPIAVGSVVIDTTPPSAPSPANVTAATAAFNNSELAGGLNQVEASNGTSVPIPLPANVTAGDVITMTWPGTNSASNQIITHTITAAEVVTGVASVQVSGVQITAAGSGTKTVTAVVRDGVGNQSAQPISVGPFIVDLVPPDAPSAANIAAAMAAQAGTALQNGINQVEAQSSIPVAVPLPTNVVAGDVVILTLPGTNGGVAQTSTHTVTAADIAVGYANAMISPAQMTQSGNGTKNITAVVTDSTGNASAAPIAVITVVLDTTPPSAPSAASTAAAAAALASGVLSGGLNAVEVAAGVPVPVALASNSAVGDIVTLTILGTGGSANQQVMYTVTAADLTTGYATVSVPQATWLASGQGNKILTAIQTDAVGNSGPQVSVGSVLLDTVAPNAPTPGNTTAAAVVFNGNFNNLINLATVAGNSSVSIPVALPQNAVAGDRVTLTIPASAGGTPQTVEVTLTSADIASVYYVNVAVPVATLIASGAGNKSFTAVFTDAVGNVGSSIPVGTCLVDLVAPAAPSAANTAAAQAAFSSGSLSGGLNAAEAAAGATVPVALPSNAVVGDVVTLTIPGTNGGASQTVSHTVTAADLTAGYASISVAAAVWNASGQGSKSMTAVVQDFAGNFSNSAISVGTVIFDGVLPNAPSAANIAAATTALNASNVSNGINAAEAAAGVSIPVALPANGVAGDVLQLSIPYASGGATTVSYTVTAADVTAGFASVPVSPAVITAAGDGSKSITAQVTDAVGNQGTSYAVATITIDTVPPFLVASAIGGADSMISAGEVPFTVTGICESGSSVNLQFGSANHAATVTGTAWSYVITAADVTSMGQGPETVQISATDGVGNVTTIAQNITVATTSQLTLSSNVDNVTNLDVMSSLVLNATETVTAVSGKFIRLVNDGGAGYSGETTVNSQTISVTDATQVTISGSRIIVKPTFNLDLANNYHIEVDAGAFVGATSGTTSTAVTDPTAINFSTVTPVGGSGSTPASAAASVKMDTSNGAMVSSFNWWDVRGVGAGDGASAGTFSLGGGSYALVFKDYDPLPIDPNTGVGIGVGNPSFQFSATNFGLNDVIYIDNQVNTLASQNDVTLIGGVHAGTAPTTLQFDGYQGLPTADRRGPGLLYVSIEGSGLGFDDYNGMVGLLGNGAKPIISG